MSVWCQGVRGGRSSPQVNAVSATAASAAYGALSRLSKVVSSAPMRNPNSASFHRTARPMTFE